MASTPEIANEGSMPGIALGEGQRSGSSTTWRVRSVFHGGSTDFGPRPSDQGPVEHTQVRHARSPCRRRRTRSGGERDRQVRRHEAGRE
jgi:hypothetical protein